ncbi:uncharacterized protein LOC106467912 [Limulus polyphemus]|uniref:Uncharacterized protein LOC106467912 n=1 Tax=Limulus polyphemus TaxID=6850 RepID=A0ABM1BKE8_LIMPO|nr:uncharacterized protein LOC106467912 [Limulus polyphemus]
MADDKIYCGTWKIVKCNSLAGGSETSGIEGTEFTLDEGGDVTWKVPENTEPMPFFNWETYEVFLGNPHYLRLFGTFDGHVIEFQVDQPKEDTIQLTYEGWCVLQCEKVSTNDSKHDVPFSFMCALEEGYFSDMIIKAADGKEFLVHSTILNLGNPAIQWDQQPCPLQGLPVDVLYVTLYYLYCECLPAGLQEETTKSCLQKVAHLPGFTRFGELCELFLKNAALKQQIISLVTDMHNCAGKIIDYFSGKGGTHDVALDAVNGPLSSSGGANGADGDNLAANPARLCYIVKQALRESAVAGAKLLILCDLFSRRNHELSREERHEIIKYCKSRLPVFMNQLHKLLEVIKQSFSNLSGGERLDMAHYLVPEIEEILDSLFQLIIEGRTALEEIIDLSSGSGDKPCCSTSERVKKGSVGEVLSRSLKNALHMRELMKLRNFHEKVTVGFMNLMRKKESFTDLTTMHKTRSVARNLEQLIDEVPMFLLRIEELRAAVDDKLTWKEWKYLFKLGTSKVAWVFSKVVSHRATLRRIINRINKFVSHEQFTKSLIHLGLLDASGQTQGLNSDTHFTPKSSIHNSSPLVPQTAVVESLCRPPMSRDSSLAKNSVQLLKSGKGTDVTFQIITVQDSTDTVIDYTEGHPVDQSTVEQEVECHEIKAHCVIIAAQCDWFRRALLSGMRESIDKKIVVHDSNPTLFRIFLEYLYGGHLETSQLSTEQLADLMQLSDRYEMDPLKQLSEEALKGHIDEDSALFLLSIGDQFNAKTLRNAALEFIALNKDIIKSDVFYDLPEDLQSEVEEMITWVELRNSQRSDELSCPQYLGADSPSSMSSSLLDIEELTSAINISGKEPEATSDSSSVEELPLTHDSAQLEACVAQLRDIVGESVPQEQLVRISLAADYDVNRALNFFFS